MLKNVAAIPASSRIRRIAPVLAPGPSSNVRATVLPLPGAKWLTPNPTAGHGFAAWMVTGAVTAPGSAASTSDCAGPAGDGSGAVGDSGAARATGAARKKAPTSRATTRIRPV